ncbi:MAG: branched-chain amino acid transport system ATP-binding protein [Acidimicrobiaceae bacterium]
MSLLEARSVTKKFGGILALDAVSLSVEAQEIVGLVGPNGAGKTTLFNCLLGMLRPEGGSITFDGTELTRLATHRRARLGIGRTFQRVELFAGLSVREHLLVAERVRGGGGGLWQDLLGRGGPRPAEIRRADEVLALLGIGDVALQPVEALTLGQSRLVEIGRALIGDPRLLLLDEPSSGLDATETAALGTVLTDVRRERGTAILLVEHDLAMVRNVCERLYVLDFGALLAQGACADVLRDERVITAYLGVSG